MSMYISIDQEYYILFLRGVFSFLNFIIVSSIIISGVSSMGCLAINEMLDFNDSASAAAFFSTKNDGCVLNHSLCRQHGHRQTANKNTHTHRFPLASADKVQTRSRPSTAFLPI